MSELKNSLPDRVCIWDADKSDPTSTRGWTTSFSEGHQNIYVRANDCTRTVPDVPELVRYTIRLDRSHYDGMVVTSAGAYVRYDQAAEIIAAKDAEIERLREALKPFAMYMKNNGDGRIDLNNKNDPLPDTDTVGWVYLTYKDFRMAEGALGEGNA